MAGIINPGDQVVFKSHAGLFFYSENGDGQLKLSPNPYSFETFIIEPVSVGSPIFNYTVVFIKSLLGQSKGGRWLNTPEGNGPNLFMSNQGSPDLNASDEIWYLIREAGPGQLQSGDRIFLKSRKPRYIGAAYGLGPDLKMSPNDASDEAWTVYHQNDPNLRALNLKFDKVVVAAPRTPVSGTLTNTSSNPYVIILPNGNSSIPPGGEVKVNSTGAGTTGVITSCDGSNVVSQITIPYSDGREGDGRTRTTILTNNGSIIDQLTAQVSY